MNLTDTVTSRLKRGGKIGAYILVTSAGLLALLLAVNLAAGALPRTVSSFDVTELQMTGISQETEKLISTLKEDVTIYWLCENGEVDRQLELFLARFAAAGTHLSVQIVDPLEDPNFTLTYGLKTANNYSFIVESDRRFEVVDTANFYYYTNDFVTQYLNGGVEAQLSYQELSQIYNYYGSYMASFQTHVYFRAESLLVAALDFVTRETIPHAYVLTGHNEAQLTETMLDMFSRMDIQTETLDLREADAVPADANCLILHAPTTDISEQEAARIRTYLGAGGSLMLTTSPKEVEHCPNIMSLAQMFGLSAAPGLVKDGTAEERTDVLKPTANSEHYTANYVSSNGYKMQMPQAHAITVAETLPTDVKVTPIFSTSAESIRVALDDKSDTPLGGKGAQFVAVSASKSLTTEEGTTITADIVWYASAEAFTDTHAQATSGGNYYYYTATVAGISERFSSPYEELSALRMTGNYLTEMTQTSRLLTGAVMLLVVPGGFLAAGILMWSRRKKQEGKPTKPAA